MATEKRLIDPRWLTSQFYQICEACQTENISIDAIIDEIDNAPEADAMEVEKYNALVEMYNDLRDNFIDYVCSGTSNVAPYCLNRCEGCVDRAGWCNQGSDECHGFNPDEVILDGDGNG